jgi:hypothetical protein
MRRKKSEKLASKRELNAALKRLRSEIAALSVLPPLSPQFTSWLERLFALVEANFGSHSDELRQLRAIAPELPSEFFDSVQSRFAALGFDEKLSDALLMKLNKEVPVDIFRKRLRDYDEFVASLVLSEI